MLMALAARPAAADPPPGAPNGPPAPPLDSLQTPPPPDSAAAIVEVGQPRTPRASPAKPGRFSEPRYVMFRSLLIPGWGQLYNHSWVKATLLGGLEYWMIAGLVQDERDLKRLTREANEAQAIHDEDAYNAAVSAYNDRLDRSISRRWLLGGVIAYALLDSYVDAHFRNFAVEFGPDPALPPDMAPTGGGKSKGKGGGRMSLRWSF